MKFQKNILMLSVALAMGLVLTACGNDASADRTSSACGSAVEAEDGGASLSEETGAGSGETEAAGAAYEGTAGTEDAPEAGGNILVAYFSHTGSTREVAELIAGYTGGDLAEIKRAEEYGDLQEEAEVEILDGVHSEITVSVSNVADYETIFAGYPIW